MILEFSLLPSIYYFTKMRVRGACLLVLILSLLFVDVSALVLFRPVPGQVLSKIPSGLRKLRMRNDFWIFNELNRLYSLLRAHGGRLQVKDIADGISKVQDYLEAYGYLDSILNPTDKFTSELETAVKHFQKIFNLNVTGQLDYETMWLINRPRCGVPDINGSTTISSWEEHRTTTFKRWWPEGKKELTYAFPPGIQTASIKDVFTNAFRRWSKETMLNFTETKSFHESDIQIAFRSLGGKGGVVGYAEINNTARTGEVVLDTDEEWALPSENTTGTDHLDLESTVMHQIGHVLGLDHSSIEEAVMYPYVLPQKKRKVDFAKDDVERIQQLYATASPSPHSAGRVVGGGAGGDDGGAAIVGPTWGLTSALGLGLVLTYMFF